MGISLLIAIICSIWFAWAFVSGLITGNSAKVAKAVLGLFSLGGVGIIACIGEIYYAVKLHRQIVTLESYHDKDEPKE